jgi:hypothetical protein
LQCLLEFLRLRHLTSLSNAISIISGPKILLTDVRGHLARIAGLCLFDIVLRIARNWYMS